jgi:hypothetical protein
LLSCHTKQSKLIPPRELLLNLLCIFHAICHTGAKNSQERKKIQIFSLKKFFGPYLANLTDKTLLHEKETYPYLSAGSLRPRLLLQE